MHKLVERGGTKKLTEAIEEWLQSKGHALYKGEKFKLSTFCQLVDIPYKMFLKYVTSTPNKQRKICHGQGPALILRWEAQRYVADFLACCYQVKKGCDVDKAVDIVCELTKKGTRKQAYQHVKKPILPNFTELLKKKVVVA